MRKARVYCRLDWGEGPVDVVSVLGPIWAAPIPLAVSALRNSLTLLRNNITCNKLNIIHTTIPRAICPFISNPHKGHISRPYSPNKTNTILLPTFQPPNRLPPHPSTPPYHPPIFPLNASRTSPVSPHTPTAATQTSPSSAARRKTTCSLRTTPAIPSTTHPLVPHIRPHPSNLHIPILLPSIKACQCSSPPWRPEHRPHPKMASIRRRSRPFPVQCRDQGVGWGVQWVGAVDRYLPEACAVGEYRGHGVLRPMSKLEVLSIEEGDPRMWALRTSHLCQAMATPSHLFPD